MSGEHNPVEFLVEYGPILSPEESLSISWREDKLICREGLSVAGQVDITPGDGDWESFWSVLDDIGFWDWNPEYNLCSMEGTRWQVIVEYGDRELHCSGLNHYPDTFPDFIKALEELTSRDIKIPH